jgi:hypothetical protein
MDTRVGPGVPRVGDSLGVHATSGSDEQAVEGLGVID